MIYGEFNTAVFNAQEVDGGKTIVVVNDALDAAEISQNVGVLLESFNVCAFSQDVQLKVVVDSFNIISIQEDVQAIIASQNICSIGENVISLTENTFLNRNNYTVQITIAGQVLPDAMITGSVKVSLEESQSNQASISLLVNDPVSFIDDVWGQTILIDYITHTTSQRLFTGVVAIPEIDLINRVVKLTCSNNRDEIINNTLASVLPTIGRYSFDVQGEVTDTASEMNYRMTTVQKSLDFNAYNVGSFNSWFAKDTADYTLSAADIYYREPKVTWQDRTKVKNKESIEINYQYTRLYHYQRPFAWDFPYDFCTFLFSQYSLPSVQSIEDAISSAKWKLPGTTIIFTSVFPPGVCASGASFVAWNTANFGQQGTYSTIFDSLGNVISDPDGNNVYGFRPFTNQDDLSTIYTIGAEWVGSVRFSQYIVEKYSLTVQSSQSIAQFGAVTLGNTKSLKDDFDASSWENYAEFTPPPSNAVSFSGGSYYFNQDTAPGNMTNALLTSIDIAKSNIYSTHRNTYVVAETPLKPYLDLKHTVKFDSDLVTAKGKVQKLVHTMDIAENGDCSTEVTIALFRSRGSATETPTAAPARPSDSVDMPTSTIVLGSHYGVDDESFNGFIGNKLNLAVVGQPRTNVQEQFRVDTPAIEDAYRQTRTLNASATYDVNIPNDLLEITLE